MPCGVTAFWNQAVEELSTSATVLVGAAHDQGRRELAESLLSENYQILEAKSTADLIGCMGQYEVDLAVLDAQMPGVFGWCRRFKRETRMELTPVLMLLHQQGPDMQIHAIDSGADDLLGQPFHPDVLRSRIRAMLRHNTAIAQLEQSESIFLALAQAIEKRDNATGNHCERLSRFAVALGMSVGLPRRSLLALYRGGYLHDIGKVGIPDAILLKPGPLDAAEWEVMKTHTVKGEEICRSLKTLGNVLPIIRSHHERWDGSGYPDGLRGADIPLLARILQLADVYDALTSVRPYKPALSPEDALAVMHLEAQKGWRDRELMRAFAQLHHSGVLSMAAEQTAEWGNVDSIRSSLVNLGRQLEADRSLAGGGHNFLDSISLALADSRQSLFEVRKQVAPVLDSDGDPYESIADTRIS
jgi:putative two-component system response regulator